ncbi:DNA gyrase inhibitor YacG [Sneathiella sp. P13V-1]|uniref:DNA gyrase inhibitor YacG n=1 Tax=Sneathiella sp. P13V-1 TaxID=2697366 RepID=UPI00187B3E27|nr:DNA gyrase inhibitor YacG [Sneathiella sp. P13V-1]MBE7635260.1 DNA gyrase inhibitor YacG [Sneathiella sp. P13V-1]
MTPSSKKSEGKCPQCGKPAEQKFRPFCSQRCQQLDLGKWLNESYAIPGEEAAPSFDDDPEY